VLTVIVPHDNSHVMQIIAPNYAIYYSVLLEVSLNKGVYIRRQGYGSVFLHFPKISNTLPSTFSYLESETHV
jgi:hypothetical protein